jgi:gamma-butyrobetaine dioxygenase
MAAMGTIDIDSNKMKKFYEAYYLFAKLLHSKKFKIDFRLESGDIFCFNNRRVLHGRTAFDPNSGNRHLQGYYLERDEILARLNYFNKLQV